MDGIVPQTASSRGLNPHRTPGTRELTALLGALVVADQGLLVGGAEESGPVDGAVVAELAVLGDVHVAGADLPQGLEVQGGDALLLEDQQGDSTEWGTRVGGERRSSGPKQEARR